MKIFKENRAQSIMIDAMAAFFLFAIIFGYLSITWAVNFSTIEKNYIIDDMQRLSFQTTDLLIKSRGSPGNWETMDINDVNVIGLAEKDRVIDEQKLNAFKNLGAEYDKVREILQIANYDFYFELQGTDSVTAGLAPMADADKVVVNRIVNYKGSDASVTFTLYKLRP